MKILVLFIIFYLVFELSVFKIYRIKISNKKIKKSIKIIQISDYHNNIFLNNKKLKYSIDQYKPDLIFLTGDIISRNTKKFNRIDSFLSIFSNYKTYFVEGNHELDNKDKSIYKLIDKYGIKNLSASYEKINLMDTSIKIYGNSFGIDKLKVFELDEKNYNILLSHSPEDYLFKKDKFDLVLSGHKHGGQIRLPFFGQIIDHKMKFFPKYSKGLYDVGKTKLYIDSGLGQSVYIRIFDRISYSQIEIKKEN